LTSEGEKISSNVYTVSGSVAISGYDSEENDVDFRAKKRRSRDTTVGLAVRRPLKMCKDRSPRLIKG
jgi:hypothetical protein